MNLFFKNEVRLIPGIGRKKMDGGDNDGLRCLRDSNNFRWASKNSHTSRPREITVKRVHVEAKPFFPYVTVRA